ncbi:MAG: GGDEF domain-containing protein [Lachnospiraceae bacterium]|nr:GGDEF domain-containing protein [Lachnospiraceae bacterium]
MDYGKLISAFQGTACVLSLRKEPDQNGCDITVVEANNNYLASVRKQREDFVSGKPYTEYVPQDANFEALVHRCIDGHRIAHQYVNAGLYMSWLDIYMLPLEEDSEGNGYCIFSYEMTSDADSDKILDISTRTAYEVLRTCIKLRETDDFGEAIQAIVKDIRVLCESDGCAILLADWEKEVIDFRCFDSAEDDEFTEREEDVFFRQEFYRIVNNWSNILAGSNCFIISKEEELKKVEEKDPAWYRSLLISGVRNLVLYPLRVGENLYGYIFATNFNSDKTEFIREVMELNSFILSAEVENYRMHQKLETLSKVDMLTGVLNRNAMNRRIEQLTSIFESEKSGVGVVFADVNGLKQVNDTKGHGEGDAMLRSVSDKLKSVFKGKEIYRAGGDEFLVIVADTTREEFFALFEQIKALSQIEGEPTFALGAEYDDMVPNISKIMQTADKKMYKDKAEYYLSHPKADRRNRE